MKKHIFNALSLFFVGLNCLFAVTQEDAKSVACHYMREISKIQMNADVHVLDPLVEKELQHLVALGQQTQFGQDSLSVEEMKDILNVYLDQNPGFYTAYESSNVNHDELKGFIEAALSTASRDPNVLKLYSLGVSALDSLEKSQIETKTERQSIYDVFAENYKTNGGCFQGVRNRMFVYYSMLLISR